ncbi:uncharacterized protein DDB_G0271670-like isoform X2 [Panonychus citri]|nr:uncharacterized protein DDB_G0271670-like isoform X2 [Panonychus citri]
MTPFACPLEVNTSPLPLSPPAYLKYPRDRSNSSCSHYRGSPYDLTVNSPELNSNPFRRNSDPMARNSDHDVRSPPLAMDMEEEEYDQPLDMSKKSRILSSSSSSSSPPLESHHSSDHHHLRHHHNSLHHHHHGSTSSSSSSSTSSRSNTCSPESIYKGNHMNSKNFIPCRQNSIYHNQPHHVYQQSPPPPTINCPTSNIINHHNHINSHNGNPHLQHRPSVITCASTLFGPRRSTSSSSSTSSNQHHPHQTICPNNNNGKDESILYSSHHNHNQNLHHNQINSGLTSSDKTLNTSSPRPSSLASTASSSSLSSFSSSSSSCSSSFNRHHHQSTMKSQTMRPETANELNSFNNKHGKKRPDGHNQLLILGEDSDSGIDEHFRRSLGDHYRNYTNVSMSVDDHFAKALGDTWLKLQRDSQNGSKGNSYNKQNTATIS